MRKCNDKTTSALKQDSLVPVKNANTVFRVVDGEAVVVDIPGNMVNVINRVGTRIWEMVDGKRNVRDIAGLIAADYGIPVKTAIKDTLLFCRELCRNNLLVLRSETDDANKKKA